MPNRKRISRDRYVEIVDYIDAHWDEILEDQPSLAEYIPVLEENLDVSVCEDVIKAAARCRNHIWPGTKGNTAEIAREYIKSNVDEIAKGFITQAKCARLIKHETGVNVHVQTIAEAWHRETGIAWPSKRNTKDVSGDKPFVIVQLRSIEATLDAMRADLKYLNDKMSTILDELGVSE